MNETRILLVAIAIVLGLTMLVGHGLWVLVAALFRLAFGGSVQRSDAVRCAFCGRPVAPDAQRCEGCNHPVHGPWEEELADLDATERQLRRFEEAGHVKPRTASRLLARLDQYRQQRLSVLPAWPGPSGSPAEESAELPELPEPTASAPAAPPAVRTKIEEPIWAEVVEAEVATRPPELPNPFPESIEPARPWQEALGQYLSDREIHWAELIGVLLGGFIMVGASLALVVNLWQTLEHVPYLKFFVFVAYTSLIFVAGLYAFYRWKLRSTGGGLLVIAMLLVPLNFLAMASLWRSGMGYGAIAAEAAALAVFLLLVRLAAGAIMPEGRWFAPLAVAGNSAAVLGMARFVHAGQSYAALAVAACVPVVVFAAAISGYLFRSTRKPSLRPSDAAPLLILLAVAGFALCVAIGLYLSQTAASLGSLAAAMNLLAAPMALAAVPTLAVGVRLMRVVGLEASTDNAPNDADANTSAASYVAAGTLVALLAMLLQLAALGLAWPEPSSIVAVGLFNAAGLVFVAFRHHFPIAHAGAMACAGLSYLVSFHGAVGNLEGIAGGALHAELLKLAVAAQTGTALGGLFVAFALASLLLKRLPERRHGQIYAAGSAVVAVLGLLLVTYHGLVVGGADAVRAAALYSVYGAGSLALAALWRDRQFASLGIPLVAAAPLWGLWASTAELAPVAAVLLAFEALLAAILAFALGAGPAGRRERLRFAYHGEGIGQSIGGGAARMGLSSAHAVSLPDVFHRPLAQLAEVLAVLAAGLWVITAWTHRAAIDHALPPVVTVAVLAVFYFVNAWVHRSMWRTWAGSMVGLAGLTHALAWNFSGTVQHPWLIAPLVHGTVGLLAATALDGIGSRQRRLRRRLRRVFADPLAESALFSSVVLLPALPHIWQTNWTFASGLFWLAALWLTIAVRSGNRFVFGAHQVMLAAAAVVATTVRLDTIVPGLSDQWFKPAYLQIYGISLAAVLLPWPVLGVLGRRLSARGRSVRLGSSGSNGRHLLEMCPSVDGVLRHILVALQFLLAAIWLAPELARELGLPIGPMAEGVHDTGTIGAWLLAGMLAAALIVDLWRRWGRAELVSALVLAGTVPWLLAARAIDQVAVASALRWTAGGLFLVASALVWWRDGLERLMHAGGARRLGTEGAGPHDGMPPTHLAQAALLVFGLLPVVVPTLLAVALRFDYGTPRGPLSESPFFAIGRNMNNLGPLALLAVTLVGYALRERSAAYAFGSILLANLAGLVAWQSWGPAGLHGLLLAHVFAMAGAAVFWTAMKRLLPRRTPPLSASSAGGWAPNHLAAQGAVALVVLLVVVGAIDDISGDYHMTVGRLDAFGLLAAVAAVSFCLCDPSARFPIAALYFLGLSAVGFGLNYRDFGAREYVWTSAPELAGAMLGAGVIGWLFARLRAKSAAWVVSAAKTVHSPAGNWFHTCQAGLGAVAAGLALWVSFDINNDGVGVETALFGLAGRWAGPPTALMLLGAGITMAWQAAGERRRLWQMAAFGAGFLLNLTIGLAALDATPGTPVGNALWLNRCAVLLTGSAMLLLLSRFGLKGALPRSGDWLETGRDVSPVFAAITTVTLPLLLMAEFVTFELGAGAPVAAFSVVAIPVLLMPLAAACLMYALQTARAVASATPASEQPQPAPTIFVYAAEAIVAMAALHVWLCEPQWFRLGFVEQYWMFVVMAVAFAGVGVSEWFHRAGLPVLSEPLRNTAAVLPVVPMAGFWFVAPAESLLGLTGSTPALWLLMALFYGCLAAMKPASILYGVLTLLTASVGLWVLLDRQQLDFFTHPQLWLIPPALAMLVAERVNRLRLGRRQREALRYLGLSVIYIASTTEFMRGIGESIWLPLVLLGLSVAGVLAGVALRIRSYIYLGMTFLAVVLVRMIVYAAFEQGQMWLFWVCCILLGASIIALFAAFERRRNDIVAAARKFRQWDA